MRLLLLCLLPFSVCAQNFAPNGAEWHYTPWCDCPPEGYESLHFAINAYSTDSIEGLACSNLYWSDYDVIQPAAEITVCEGAGKVYFYDDETLNLLYDFTLGEGDTMVYHVPGLIQQYYDLTCCEHPFSTLSARAIITAVHDTIIDGKTLIVQTTIPVEADAASDQYDIWNLETVIERIGSTSGLFGHGPTCCLAGIPGELRCYSDAEMSAVFVDYDCFPYDIVQSGKTLFIYPAITSGQFSVQSTMHIDAFFITDLSGSIVTQEQFTTTVDVSDLASGTYFIFFIAGKEITPASRFIKTTNPK